MKKILFLSMTFSWQARALTQHYLGEGIVDILGFLAGIISLPVLIVLVANEIREGDSQ